MRSRERSLKRYAAVLAAALVCLAVSVHHLTTLDENPFFGDESYWMGKSLTWFLLLEGRLDDPFWRIVAIDQPMLVPYTYGIVAWLGGLDKSAINTVYDFSKDYATNVRQGALPDGKWWWRCRILSTVCGLLGCVAAMIVVWRLTGPIGGLAVVILLGMNPHYIRSTQRAMSEGMLSMWLLAGWLICAVLATTLERGSARRAWQLAVILGVTLGLATMTKLTAAPLFFAVAVVGLHRAWRSDWARTARRAIGGWRFPLTVTGVTLAIGYLVFIAQSPRTWRNPIAGPWQMVTWRQSIMEDRQQAFLTEYAITSIPARMETVPARLWHDTGTFASTGISKRTHVTWLDGWTFLGGLLWLLLAERKARVGGDASRHGDLVVAWAWLAALILPLLLVIPADWDRYYLSGFIATAVVQAVGLGALSGFVARRAVAWRAGRGEAKRGEATP